MLIHTSRICSRFRTHQQLGRRLDFHMTSIWSHQTPLKYPISSQHHHEHFRFFFYIKYPHSSFHSWIHHYYKTESILMKTFKDSNTSANTTESSAKLIYSFFWSNCINWCNENLKTKTATATKINTNITTVFAYTDYYTYFVYNGTSVRTIYYKSNPAATTPDTITMKFLFLDDNEYSFTKTKIYNLTTPPPPILMLIPSINLILIFGK